LRNPHYLPILERITWADDYCIRLFQAADYLYGIAEISADGNWPELDFAPLSNYRGPRSFGAEQ
jgi:hypothetical protein